MLFFGGEETANKKKRNGVLRRTTPARKTHKTIARPSLFFPLRKGFDPILSKFYIFPSKVRIYRHFFTFLKKRDHRRAAQSPFYLQNI